MVKIIPNARKTYNFGCLEESDDKRFSGQAEHIVDLKVEKGDFAAQAQGFVKEVTRLCRSDIIGFSVSECCFKGVEPRCYIGIRDAECLPKSSLLREVSWETLVLEAWMVTFRGSGKCSFWKLGFALLVRVS